MISNRIYSNKQEKKVYYFIRTQINFINRKIACARKTKTKKEKKRANKIYSTFSFRIVVSLNLDDKDHLLFILINFSLNDNLLLLAFVLFVVCKIGESELLRLASELSCSFCSNINIFISYFFDRIEKKIYINFNSTKNQKLSIFLENSN